MIKSIICKISIIFSFLFVACNNNPDNEASNKEIFDELENVQRKVTGEDGPLKKTIEYSIKVDSVDFSIKAAVREDSTVAVRFNFYHLFTLAEHLNYQEKLMFELTKDFNPKKITSIFLGRLLYTGDLAIKVSKEIEKNQWDEKSYPQLKTMLDSSCLVTSFHQVISPYGLQVKGISFEKAFFIDKKTLSQYSTISVPDEEVPEKILDCMAWLIIE